MKSVLKSFFFPALLMIGIIGEIFLSSFQAETIQSSKLYSKIFQTDSTIVSPTVRTRLGKSQFYVEKPIDCIENILMEAWNESDYEIKLRKKTPRVMNGYCSITTDQNYVPRLSLKNGELVFIDTVLKQPVTVKEYSKTVSIQNYSNGTELIREFELSVNGIFIFVQCSGFSKAELEKYYAIGKSLSN